ncbi:MAG TPA: PQQ-binding-like beta-propeller repeat protein [Thermohalobaculum sp.]|nr:PQQ-binding-like beta-propeller repeat protein [Thermohalobaculum sp.]
MRNPGIFARKSCSLALGVIGLLAVTGCGWFSDDEILEGERIHLRAEPAAVASGEAAAVPLPPAQANSEWSQTNGTASHNLGNLSGPSSLSIVWTADAGAGDSSDGAITSSPIVIGGKIYTLDAGAGLTSFSASSGSKNWRVSLAHAAEAGKEGFGGGLAADGGTIYAATGFGEVMAVSAATGEILWRKGFGAPFRAAPAAAGGLVVAVTRDNRAVGLDGSTGNVRWRMQVASSEAGLLGGASPAIAGRLVALPFTSGELVGIEGGAGRRLWSAVLSGGRKGLARSAITDISGDPVVVGPYVVAANQSGRMIAIDGRSGQRVWTRNLGSASPIWAAGETIFMVSDAAQIMRISVRDGRTLWSTQMPAYRDQKDLENPISYSGPVLVDGRLLLTDSLGNLQSFDAMTGAAGPGVKIGGGSVTGPVVANGTVYVLSDNGTLYAFR